MSEYSQHYGILSHCVWISVISVFPLIYCGLFFAIKNTITIDQGNTQLILPDIARVNISGPAAELYPHVSGEYRLLPDITVLDRPVYRHTGQDSVLTKDYYIYIGMNYIRTSQEWTKVWTIAHQSLVDLGRPFGKFFQSARTEDRVLPSNLVLQEYSGYPNCRTVGYSKDMVRDEAIEEYVDKPCVFPYTIGAGFWRGCYNWKPHGVSFLITSFCYLIHL